MVALHKHGLKYQKKNNKFFIKTDSDTSIVKGLWYIVLVQNK